MAVITLPPAPNWFSSSLVSCSHQGWLVFGAKNCLVFVQHQHQDGEEGNWREAGRGKEPKVEIHYDAHGDRAKVTSVCWLPSKSPGPKGQNLVSASEDGIVRAWHWEDGASPPLTLISQHSVASSTRARVTSLSWSPVDPSLVLSSNDDGSLVAWDLAANTTRTLGFGRNAIFSVAAHPEDDDVAAFGCKLGLVFIVSLRGSGKVLHKMRGHDEDVYSVSWSPSSEVRIGDELHSEWLLASSSRDRSVRLWSSRGGRTVHTLRLPFNKGKGPGNNPCFMTVCWTSPTILLTSGGNGELLSWNLEKPGKKGGSEFSTLHRDHFKNLFSIAAWDGVAYTIGQDRALIATHLDTGRQMYALPTFAGFLYCLASNPVDPSLVAIGAGDSQIRVWRTASQQLFDITNIHAKLNQAKVMSLAWHPSREGLLAFGTDEGRVGWVEALSSSRVPNISNTQHRNGVYSVTWGPALIGESELALYSCGDGKVLQHNIKTGASSDIQEAINSANNSDGARPAGRSQVLWVERGEVKLLLLGCDDGSVEVYRVPDLAQVATIKSHTKLIQSISLHPEFMVDGKEASKESSMLLACASNEYGIHIHDLGAVFELAPNVTSPLNIISPARELKGHLQRVIELAWSPHTEGRLVSVSYDFTCQVWDALTGAPLHNFRGHSGRLMCCMWHPALDMVLTGGEEGSLMCWKPEECQDNLPIERKKEKRGKAFKMDDVAEATAQSQTKEATPKKDEVGSNGGSAELSFDELLAQHRAQQSKVKVNGDHAVREEVIENGSEATSRVTKKAARSSFRKMAFPVCSASEVKSKGKAGEECVFINKMNKQKATTESENQKTDLTDQFSQLSLDANAPHLALFTDDRDSMLSLLDKETEALKVEDKELASQVSIWSGDLGPVIENAITEACLTERLVALSAGVSTLLWRRAAKAFGLQLVKVGDVSKGADYLLMAGAVREAISELSKAGQHRAALAVARTRLPASDPTAAELLAAWAVQCGADGNFATAARCWAGAGDHLRCAEQLARLGDPKSLQAAAVLAGSQGRGPLYARQALTAFLYSGDMKSASALVGEVEALSWAKPLCSVHSEVLAVVEGKKESEKNGLPGKDRLGLLEKLRNDFAQIGEKEKDEIESFSSSSTHVDEKKKRLLQVSGLICSSLSTSSAPQTSLGAIAQALHLLFPSPSLLIKLVPALLPEGSLPPSAGKSLLGKPLDWQCNWPELRSIQTSEAAARLFDLEKGAEEKEEEQLALLADAFMHEDIIQEQKLQAEIDEGEKAVKNFKPEAEMKSDETGENEENKKNGNGGLDLTPSLSGTQTLSLSGGGEWKSQGVSDGPAPGRARDMLPPPPPLSKSFYQRFLQGKQDTVAAVQELQKLRWSLERSRTSSPSSPFPCLSLLCSRYISLLVDRCLQERQIISGDSLLARNLGLPPPDQADGEQEVDKLGLVQRLARGDMAEVGFYIDTGAREEEVEEEDVDGSEDEDKVLGSRDAAVEKRQRERAAKERNLSSFLFGKLSDNVKEIVDSEAESDEEDDEVDESDLDDNDLEVDSNDERVKSGNEEESEDENSEDQEESSSVQPSLPSDVFGGALNLPVNKRKRKAAWVDKDDADIKVKDVVATYTKAKGKHGLSEVSEELYGKALNRKFKSVVGEPAWASLDKEEGGDSDEEFLRETTNLTQKRSKGSLAQGKLVYRRLKDLNGGTHKEGAVIRATEFHPTSTVGLVAGNNGTATLFQVDGKENPKIQTINFQNFPIRTAKFSKSGTEFIVGSQQHPHYFVYDMMIGKSIKVPWKARSGEHTSGKFEVSPDGKYLAFRGAHGNIHIVSARTKELLKTLKMNDECQDMVFSGTELWTTGAGGEVYMWDLRTFTALNKFTDDGSLSSTALAISPHYLATGSSSGVVNIYSLPSLKSSTTPKPEKILLNLTTVIEVMEFNPSGEALVMASTAKEGAAKIVHFPSMTVFENFPGSKNLARVNCVGFSPGGGYLSFGNNRGSAPLFRLGHYLSY